jgi:DNA-binding NarL/FixJ family response regulator
MLGDGDPLKALGIVDARLASEQAASAVSPLGVPRLLLVRAESLTALGRYEDAHDTLEEARRAATAQGARPMLWRTEAAFGNLHRAQRQRLEARKAFDNARTIADELATQIADDQLRGRFLNGLASLVPSGPQPSAERVAKDALGGLTKRERDVAELVAQGKANRAIARELGIGERTVEGYVTSALAKLDLTSRTQLAAWAIEKGVAAVVPRSKR